MLNLGFSAVLGIISTIIIFIIAIDLVGKISDFAFTALIMSMISLALFSLLFLWHFTIRKN